METDIARLGIAIKEAKCKMQKRRQARRMARIESEAREMDRNKRVLDAFARAAREQLRRDHGKLILEPYSKEWKGK